MRARAVETEGLTQGEGESIWRFIGADDAPAGAPILAWIIPASWVQGDIPEL
jgi:hypothetical protein